VGKRTSHGSNLMTAGNQDISLEQAQVDTLHLNAIGLPGVLYVCLAGAAPITAMFFNVPNMASQAGAAMPLVFLFSAIGLIALGVPIVHFSRRLSSAGGFYTWISHGLGARTAFVAGWLMLGGYALFEAASQAAFGGLTDNTVSTFVHFHMPGGWLTHALPGVLAVSLLAYFDVHRSVWALAPFLVLELGSLLVFDLVITIRGGIAGHDLLHTFTLAGTNLKAVAPGGLWSIGVAMALGVWSWVGCEAGVVYGEESRQLQRVVPLAIFSVIVGLALLYVWMTYSAVIGPGWQHAGDIPGNIANAPGPYFDLAGRVVGGWLVACMIIAISACTFSANLAFRNGLGREQILPAVFGRTHPRWKSLVVASITQSIFTALVLGFLGLVIQRNNADGSVTYALGIVDGTTFQQTNGISSYGRLAITGTICFLLIYLLTNLAAPLLAHRRGEFAVLTPIVSSLALLIPVISFVLPPLPGIGSLFTGLDFFPSPFPLNILPLFVLFWLAAGIIYATLPRRSPERY